ncbi:MAG: hypothetical protein ACM3NR_01450, partial [Methanosarcina sp.]
MKKSFEEKQLSRTMVQIEKVTSEINDDLDLIYEELERKGKWNEFMCNIDKVKPRKGRVDDVLPENYYEALHFVFHITDKYEEFRTVVEISAIEAFLLEGKGIEAIELPEDFIEMLNNIGIRIEPGVSVAPVIKNHKYNDCICDFYMKSTKIL